jgi:hypothetical protein
MPDGLEYRIINAQRLEHHEAVDDLAQVDGILTSLDHSTITVRAVLA